MMISLECLGLLLILLVHRFYLKPTLFQRGQTINMLKMLPAWLFERNPEACAIIHS
jgi:hypothetical protein